MSDLDEKEQIAEIREWWSEYGTTVLVGVGIVILGYGGFSWFQNQQVAAEIAASSTLYDEVAESVDAASLEEAVSTADQLFAEYGDSAYAAQARLALARLYMDRNRDDDAATVLGELLASGAPDVLKDIGRVRLARILLYQENAEQVLALLDEPVTPGFVARVAEIRGDAEHALGNDDAAREAYLEALSGNSETINPQVVQLKLLDLPVAGIGEAATGGEDASQAASDETEDGE